MDPSFYADGTARPAHSAEPEHDAYTAGEPARTAEHTAGDAPAAAAAHPAVAAAARTVALPSSQLVRLGVFALLAFALIRVLVAPSGNAAAGSSHAATTALPHAQPPAAVLEDAAAHWRAHATFRGWPGTTGYLVAAGDTTVVVSADLDGRCWMGGIVDLGAPTVQMDPTGQACTTEAVAEVQAALDGTDATRS